jgi:hypothetical protein
MFGHEKKKKKVTGGQRNPQSTINATSWKLLEKNLFFKTR